MKRTAPILLLFALGACGGSALFEADTEVPDGRWSRELQPEFTFDIADTLNGHDVFIDLRHTGDYAYSDLYLFVSVTGPGLPPARDTVQCLLADPTGRWYGTGSGYIKSAHVLYKLNKRFPRAGRYSIRLEQAMRDEPLEHVIDVGISVEKSAKGS